jgi:acetyl-CoA carboxylase biotin carboxyl carrier protein
MTEVKTDVSGSVWKVVCTEGSEVSAGDELIIIESMKMEIPVEAPASGTVSQIMVGEGDTVAEGQVVVKVDSA